MNKMRLEEIATQALHYLQENEMLDDFMMEMYIDLDDEEMDYFGLEEEAEEEDEEEEDDEWSFEGYDYDEDEEDEDDLLEFEKVDDGEFDFDEDDEEF